MENLKMFSNTEFGELGVMVIDGKEYFPATQCAKLLGYKNPQEAVREKCKGVRKMLTPTAGGSQEANYIHEGDLYRLIVSSKLPAAEKFERWIFDEVLPTIRKTGGYVSDDEAFINTYLPYADEETRSMFRTTLSTVRKQNEIIKQQKAEILHKEDVIVGLVDEISLAEKRQILNRVVRYNHANYRERWALLYREFENKYHIDLSRRLATYNEQNSPKCKNKIDYIDRVLGKIPELYELAAKLYENDVKALVQEMYRVSA